MNTRPYLFVWYVETRSYILSSIPPDSINIRVGLTIIHSSVCDCIPQIIGHRLYWAQRLQRITMYCNIHILYTQCTHNNYISVSTDPNVINTLIYDSYWQRNSHTLSFMVDMFGSNNNCASSYWQNRLPCDINYYNIVHQLNHSTGCYMAIYIYIQLLLTAIVSNLRHKTAHRKYRVSF